MWPHRKPKISGSALMAIANGSAAKAYFLVETALRAIHSQKFSLWVFDIGVLPIL